MKKKQKSKSWKFQDTKIIIKFFLWNFRSENFSKLIEIIDAKELRETHTQTFKHPRKSDYLGTDEKSKLEKKELLHS